MARHRLKISSICILVVCYLTQATAVAYGECKPSEFLNPNQVTVGTTEPGMSEHNMSHQSHCDDMTMSLKTGKHQTPSDDQQSHTKNCCDLSSTSCVMSHCFTAYSIATASAPIQLGEPSFIWNAVVSIARPTNPTTPHFRPPISS